MFGSVAGVVEITSSRFLGKNIFGGDKWLVKITSAKNGSCAVRTTFYYHVRACVVPPPTPYYKHVDDTPLCHSVHAPTQGHTIN